MKRLALIILDGVGVGELPDADLYQDRGSNTLGNLARSLGGLDLPHLAGMGLGYVANIQGVGRPRNPIGFWGKMAERSAGKDSTIGHWEVAGLISEIPLPLYPDGFPPRIIQKFKEVTGRWVLGNKAASGTEIINELGTQHLRTGDPIVYTSADSVLQIAAHEDIIPLAQLYQMCRRVRRFMTGKHGVGRIIARPFKGERGNFYRTPNRRDFSLPPTGKTVLDILYENGISTIGIGKIDDLFSSRGLSSILHTKSNAEGIERIIEQLMRADGGLIFANLIDFDMLWGHRNDPEGFARGLTFFDSQLPRIVDALREGDLLVITSDHGNDPTTPSTDHSREYVPLLGMKKGLQKGKDLGLRETFADVGATIADFFMLPGTGVGKSFLGELED